MKACYRYIENFQHYYRSGKISGEAGNMYMVRTAKSVLGKYNLLSVEDQNHLKQQHKEFKKDVMSHNGFGDMKLKFKCSEEIQKSFYGVENKVVNVIKKV